MHIVAVHQKVVGLRQHAAPDVAAQVEIESKIRKQNKIS
jgi:hypothetical protein